MLGYDLCTIRNTICSVRVVMSDIFEDLDADYKVISYKDGDSCSKELIKDYLGRVEEESTKKGFELTYIEELSEYFGVVKNQKIELLVYFLKEKTNINLLIKTQKQIMEDTGIGKRVVNEVMQELQKKGMMKKLSSGVYMLMPDISIRGGAGSYIAKKEWDISL